MSWVRVKPTFAHGRNATMITIGIRADTRQSVKQGRLTADIKIGPDAADSFGWACGDRIDLQWGEAEHAGLMRFEKSTEGRYTLRRKGKSARESFTIQAVVPDWIGRPVPSEICGRSERDGAAVIVPLPKAVAGQYVGVPGAPVPRPRSEEPPLDPSAARGSTGAKRRADLLRLFTEAAERGAPAPSNGELRERLGVAWDSHVSALVRDLENSGAITTERLNTGAVKNQIRRVVTICATGAKTFDPRTAAAATVAVETKATGGDHVNGRAPAESPPAQAGIGPRKRASGSTQPAAPSSSDGFSPPASRAFAPFGRPVQPQRQAFAAPLVGPQRTVHESEEERLKREFMETKGVTRVVGTIRAIYTPDQAFEALDELGIEHSRRSPYCVVDGKRVPTSGIVAHVNGILLQRQTVRVRPGEKMPARVPA